MLRVIPVLAARSVIGGTQRIRTLLDLRDKLVRRLEESARCITEYPAGYNHGTLH
jgi:hypothetical protein